MESTAHIPVSIAPAPEMGDGVQALTFGTLATVWGVPRNTATPEWNVVGTLVGETYIPNGGDGSRVPRIMAKIDRSGTTDTGHRVAIALNPAGTYRPPAVTVAGKDYRPRMVEKGAVLWFQPV